MEAKVCYRIAEDSFEIYVRRSKESEWELLRSERLIASSPSAVAEYVHYEFILSLVELIGQGCVFKVGTVY